MAKIKLDYEKVMKELGEIGEALSMINISTPTSNHIGKNKLDFTNSWLEREAGIEQLLKEYVQIVQKNVEDTKANVRSLKEQDEAIVRN